MTEFRKGDKVCRLVDKAKLRLVESPLQVGDVVENLDGVPDGTRAQKTVTYEVVAYGSRDTGCIGCKTSFTILELPEQDKLAEFIEGRLDTAFGGVNGPLAQHWANSLREAGFIKEEA